MYRFTRTATLRLNALLPDATKFEMQVAAHMRETYAYDMKVGIEIYGVPKFYWYGHIESLDKSAARNA